MIQETFYKIQKANSKAYPLSGYLYRIRNLILGIQKRWATFALPEKKIFKKWLASKGAKTYILKVQDDRYQGAKDFFSETEKVLSDASEIWMCVGEMGFRLMERDEIINGLEHAFESNHALINIIHGPRTDPNTKRIFALEKEKKVQLFKLDYYPMHHFFYIVSKTGEQTLIDESPHLEPVRAKDQDGNIVEFYRSMHRIFYFIKNTGWLSKLRLWQAKQRIKRAKKQYPLSNNIRGYPLFSILLYIVFYVLPYSFFVQPFLILADRLKLRIQDVLVIIFTLTVLFLFSPYTLIVLPVAMLMAGAIERIELGFDPIYANANTRQPKHTPLNRKEVIMTEKHTAKTDEDDYLILGRIENSIVAFVMAGLFAALSGIIIEIFFSMPTSKIYTYLFGISLSALIGWVVGNYISKLNH